MPRASDWWTQCPHTPGQGEQGCPGAHSKATLMQNPGPGQQLPSLPRTSCYPEPWPPRACDCDHPRPLSAGVYGWGGSRDQGVWSLAGEASTARGAAAQAQGWPPILGAAAHVDPSRQGEWVLAQKGAAGGPPEQLSIGGLTGAGVVHVSVVHQHLVE